MFYEDPNGNLKMYTHNPEDDYRHLKYIAYRAKFYMIEVDDAVWKYFYELEELHEKKRQAEIAKQKEKERREALERLKKYGCRSEGCPHCYYCGEDDYYCSKTSGYLDTVNRPFYDYENQIQILFHYEPMPSKKCPYIV
jgi:hypothetical protein